MSELLKLADHYYAVARDLNEQGQWNIETAKCLNTMADRLCEQNIRESHPAPSPDGTPCKIMEYDGAYKCAVHGRTWGVVTTPDEPCEGWVKP